MSDVTTHTPARGELFIHPHPIDMLLKPEQFEAFYLDIVKETSALVPDVTTQRGRDAIKSVAFKVTRTKTFLDGIGKEMNEERRHEIAIVDRARREMRDKLEALKDQVRAPLTAWEESEADRAATIQRTMDFFRSSATFDTWRTANELRDRLEDVQRAVVDPKDFGEETVFAEKARADAIEALDAKAERAEKAEADLAELDRLRKAEVDRLVAVRQEQAAEAVRRAEEQRREAEASEAHRREAEAVRVAEATAKRRADEALAEMERLHPVEVRRLENAERARVAEAKRLENEQAARERDEEHRAEVMAAAQKAIMNHGGIGIDRAKKVVLAIAAGEVPNVSIKW